MKICVVGAGAIGGLDAKSSTIRPETRFNLFRDAIFGYHRAQFEGSSEECRVK